MNYLYAGSCPDNRMVFQQPPRTLKRVAGPLLLKSSVLNSDELWLEKRTEHGGEVVVEEGVAVVEEEEVAVVVVVTDPH